MPEIGKVIISIEVQGYDEAMKKLDQLQKKAENLNCINVSFNDETCFETAKKINTKFEKIAKDKCNDFKTKEIKLG